MNFDGRTTTLYVRGKSRDLLLLFCLLQPVGWAASRAADRQQPPNIVLLYSDDAGYADFGFQGSTTFSTPRLDRLAASGIRCEQFYMTAAVCGPSRAGLMTGRYQQRFGFEENNVPGLMSPSGAMGGDMGLPLHLRTMADHLRQLGYRTGVFGKWHLGEADRFHPTRRGFDEFVGFRGGARSYFEYPTGSPPEPGRRWERGFGEFENPQTHLSEEIAREANRFIEHHRDSPFFAYVSFNAVHSPLEPTSDDLAQVRHLSGKRQKTAALAMSLDRACGQILDKLEQLDLLERTLIVFTNDNGGPSDDNASSNYPLAGTKASHLEGGIRVPALFSWPGQFEPGTTYPHPASSLDLLPTLVAAAGGDPGQIEGLDGVDLTPYLKGEIEQRPHPRLFWKKECRGAVRDGDWKLIRFADRPAELYDLSRDSGEQHNLADDHPELVRQLYKELFEWELSLERPLWQLRREFEGAAAKRMDDYRQPLVD